MTAFPVDLGSILVTNNKSKLKLEISGEALLNIPGGTTSRTTPSAIINSIFTKASWVTRGAHFRLDLTVNFVEGDGEESKSQFLVELGQVLEAAELWPQLNLTCSVPTVKGLFGQSPHISLHLRHVDFECPRIAPGRQSTQNISLAGIRPLLEDSGNSITCLTDQCVSIIHLDNIRLFLNFLPYLKPLRRKRKRPSSSNNPTKECSSRPLGDDFLADLHDSFARKKSDSQQAHRPRNVDATDAILTDTIAETLRCQLPTSRDSISRIEDRIESVDSVPPKENSYENERPVSVDSAYEIPTLEDALPLIDVAIRSMFSSTPTNIESGIKIIREKPGPALTAIAPSIWSPGYLPNLAQRSNLLPSIVRSLHSISSRAKSRNLREERGAVAHYEQTHWQPLTSSVSKEDKFANRCDLETKLWQMMARGLYDPNAARHLLPIKGHYRQSDHMDGTILTSPIVRIEREGLEAETSRDVELILSPTVKSTNSKAELVTIDVINQNSPRTPQGWKRVDCQREQLNSQSPRLLSSPMIGSILDLEEFERAEPIQLIPSASWPRPKDTELILDEPHFVYDREIKRAGARIRTSGEDDLLLFPEDLG